MKDHNEYKGIKTKVCRKCKKIIPEDSIYEYCKECFKKVEEIFEKIENYLKEYPGATAFEIEQETGIPYYIIHNFVQDGRLIEMPNEYLNIECQRCGRLILSAHQKYCPECRMKIEEEIAKAKIQLKNSMGSEKAKMHIKHRK